MAAMTPGMYVALILSIGMLERRGYIYDDFLAFKLLDLSPRNHVRVENNVSIPDLLSRLLIQAMSFNQHSASQ
jgi:hypothetical protein